MKKRFTLSVFVFIFAATIMAEVIKIAILPFEKNDRKCDFVASNINSKFFFKEIFKDYENL